MTLQIPATSANLGPGFDTLGLALQLYNFVTIKPSSCYSISIKGEGAKKPKLKVNNMFVSLFYEIYQELQGKKDPFRFEFQNNIPFARGLGSSSAVIVGAIIGAYEMANIKISKEALLNRALYYETHPDNIAPAVYGGFTSSVVVNGRVKTLKKELPNNLRAVVVIPDRAMSTAHSRGQLPKNYSMKDVVYNLSRVGAMSAAFFSEDWEMLRFIANDCMHEHRRMQKLKELFEVRRVAMQAGVLMSTLSGSGSTMFNLCYEKESEAITEALQKSFPLFKVLSLGFDNTGVMCIQR
ncbi:MAG: homoserine kinase [Sulfurospirillum sp.]|nr:homoserine kinase [Sulfurospirillum sp.]